MFGHRGITRSVTTRTRSTSCVCGTTPGPLFSLSKITYRVFYLPGLSYAPCDFLFFNYYTIIKSRCQNVFWIIWTRSLKFQSAFSKTASALLAETLVVANVLPWGIAPQPVAERQPCYLFNTTIHFSHWHFIALVRLLNSFARSAKQK